MHLDKSRDEVGIPLQGIELNGNLTVPEGAKSLVLFAHGSGSSRFSSRNQYVATVLQRAGLATLLFDLLTESEEQVDAYTGQFRFDIGLLAERLVGVTDWALAFPQTANLKIGYFGASTGAAAALIAAANRSSVVRSVVSRGGRPDLAGDVLEQVKAPVLLIVGGNDVPVIELNETALNHIHAVKDLVIVPGATHLFEEPGKLEEVAQLARDWFLRHLREQLKSA